MQREIKFRCWNGEDMVSPDYIDRNGLAHWKENSIPTSSKEIMQYTGLKDKNGTEIYEGDIISSSTGLKCEVLFGEAVEGYIGWYVRIGKIENPLGSDEWNGKNSNIEVIGNIHQHPELLK